MDKQKQIAEMANDIAYFCPDKVDDGCSDEGMNCVSCIANSLYNAGYRKIPEGAVVLTREEYDEFLRQGAMIDFLKECNKEIRKETAEKFAQRLKADVSEDNELHEALNAYLKRDYFEYIDERCKEFTGDKDEKG